MFGKKDSADKQNEAEKRRFIREQVKTDKKSMIINILKKIGITILLALFFGAVSGITILLINSLGHVRLPFTESQESGTQTPETVLATPEPVRSSGIYEPSDGIDKHTLEDYSKISEKLGAVGKACNDYIVEVIDTKNKSDWFDNEVNTSTSDTGIVYRYYGNSYYIIVTGVKSSSLGNSIYIMDQYSDRAKAELVASDKRYRIAAVRVDEENMPKKMKKHIRVARVISASGLTEGSPVIAVGSPNGVLFSVDHGFITKTGIKVAVTDNELDFFSTDINYFEDSSGAVTDINGNIVGIINNIHSDITGKGGISFVGTDELLNDIESLVAGESITYLGIEGVDVDKETAKEENLSKGVYITGVASDSPALSGGLRVADVITAIDGEEIKSMDDIKNILVSKSPGDRIKVTYTRYSGDEKLKKTNNVTLK